MNIAQDWFDESDYFTGPPLTDEMIQNAESELGFSLPDSYIALLRVRNGGIPRLKCYPMQVSTGWADDHVCVDAICGIGGKFGVDVELGSRYLISEWGYPDVGVVIGMTPASGHETIMLDYSLCGPNGEPRVIYVDVETPSGEPNVVVLASSFEQFLQGFVSCDNYPVYDLNSG